MVESLSSSQWTVGRYLDSFSLTILQQLSLVEKWMELDLVDRGYDLVRLEQVF
jgi:hypothetical protein